MKTTIRCIMLLAAGWIAPAPAPAAVVRVEIMGVVEYNQISAGTLGQVDPGDAATLVFLVDSDDFVNSGSFPTRGYVIDQSSFVLSLGEQALGPQSPFPAGQTPYFSIRDNDPAVDGFFVATSTDFPVGVPIDQAGVFGQFLASFSVTYTGDTLGSLDVLDAMGTYDFNGLTVFNFTVDDGPFQPMGLVFEQVTISLAGDCGADVDGNGAVDVDDLVSVVLDWGCVGEVLPCVGDVNDDGITDIDDLAEVVLQWGPCDGT